MKDKKIECVFFEENKDGLLFLKSVMIDVKNKKWRGLAVIFFFFTIFIFWNLSSALLWMLFLLFLVYEWESRFIALLAILSLASCPILILFQQDVFAEKMAVYAYFFLAMTVVLQAFELLTKIKNNS